MSHYQRSSRGTTIGLLIACSLIIVVVGIGLFVLSKILGGANETQNIVDAGDLNVAKLAAYSPNVKAQGLTTVVGCGPDTAALLRGCLYNDKDNQGKDVYAGPLDAQGHVPANIVTFNKMVGTALITQMNATADGSPTAQENVNSLWQAVEGNSSSVGSTLKNELSTKGGTWAAPDYQNVALPINMFSKRNTRFNEQSFGTAYLYQNANQPANIDFSKWDRSNGGSFDKRVLPITNFESNALPRMHPPGSMFSSQNGTSYMVGYQPVSIGAASVPLYAVPNGPTLQPHLESESAYAQGQNPQFAANTSVPPNAFKVGATVLVPEANNKTLRMISTAMVGLTPTFIPQIANGFIIIDNAGDPTQTQLAYSTPNTNTVAAKQLASGIITDPCGYFSMAVDPKTGVNLVQEWETTPRDGSVPLPPVSDGKGGNLYNNDGQPATVAQCDAYITYVGPSATSGIICTDTNSSPPHGNDSCVAEFFPSPAPVGAPPCAGDIAYNGASVSTSGQTSGLTAAEMTQIEAGTLFNTDNSVHPVQYNYKFGPTGMAIYPHGLPSFLTEYPWDPDTQWNLQQEASQQNAGAYQNVSIGTTGTFNSFGTAPSTSLPWGKVTVAGSIYDMLTQYFVTVKPEIAKKTITFLTQRMLEIKPTATADEIAQVLGTGPYSYLNSGNPPPFPVTMGQRSYIYLNRKTGKLAMDQVGPPNLQDLDSDGLKPDGKTILAAERRSQPQGNSNTGDNAYYDIFYGLTNCYGANNIEDQMFRTWGTDDAGENFQGGTVATDRVSVTQSSGAPGGLLGVVKFQETSNGNFTFNNQN